MGFERKGGCGISSVARIHRCPPRLISGLEAACDGAAMATVENESERDALSHQRAEESSQLLVPDVEDAGVRIRRDDRLVVPRRQGSAVDTLGAVAGEIEDDDIARLRLRHKLFDSADDMRACGRGVFQEVDVGGVEVESVAQQVAHRFRVIDRPVQRVGDQVASRGADRGPALRLRRGKAFVVVDADQQRPAGLCCQVLRRCKREQRRSREQEGPARGCARTTEPAQRRRKQPPTGAAQGVSFQVYVPST